MQASHESQTNKSPPADLYSVPSGLVTLTLGDQPRNMLECHGQERIDSLLSAVFLVILFSGEQIEIDG